MKNEDMFDRKVEYAKEGMKYWEDFCDSVDFGEKDLVIVMSKELEINQCIISFCEDIFKEYGLNRLFLFTTDLLVMPEIENGFKIYVKEISVSKLECLVSLYRLYKFTKQIIFADSESVAESNTVLLRDYGVASLHDVVYVGILGITGAGRLRAKDDFTLEEAIDRVSEGRHIFKKLRDKYSDKYIFYNNRASGNTLILGMYLNEYVKRNNIGEYVVINTRGSSQRISELLHMRSELLDYTDYQKEFENYIFFVGEKCLRLKLMDPYNERINLIRIRGVNGLDFHTIYRCLLYQDIEEKTAPSIYREKADWIFDKYNLRRGRTILLSPAAVTIKELDDGFWEKLIYKLYTNDFDVLINASEKEVPELSGKKFQIPFEYIEDFLNQAGGFIGIRSGLCDLISKTSAKMVVLYNTDERMFSYFSLVNMGFRKHGITEMITRDDHSELDEIIQYFITG